MSANQFAEMRQQVEDARGDMLALLELQKRWIGHADVGESTTPAEQAEFLLGYINEVEADQAEADLPDDNCTGSGP